jgi:ABC-type nitrate/sulfonate/bicarbonate transport system substrate-binding protein
MIGLRFPRVFALIGALVLALAVPTAAQTNMTELSLAMVAPSASELEIYIADKEGFFRDEGLHVSYVTGGSPSNVINLIATGSVGIAVDSTDNAMGAIAHGLPLKLMAPGFQANPYTLVTAASIKDWSQLKGASVLIGQKLDVSGIALARMAQAHGMTMDDFNLVVGTSTTARYTGLMSGNVQATMLNQPYDIEAQVKGMRILAVAHDYIKDWAFQSIVVNTNWLAANRPAAVHFLRAIRKAIQYGYSHPDQAVTIMAATTNITPDIGRKAYDLNWRQWRAFDPDLRFNLAGMRAVAQGAVGSGILTSVPEMSTFYDTSVVTEALR